MALFAFKKNKLWIWKAYCRDTGQFIDWECGNRDTFTLNKMLTRLKKWNVKIYITDNWKPYAEIIPQNILLQSKKKLIVLKETTGVYDIGLLIVEGKHV